MPGGSNTSTILSWVRPDLDKHLDQIRAQLENVAESTHIGSGIRHTAENLTELNFIFRTLVFQGVTPVVEEMIAVCKELENEGTRDREEAFGALMNAIVVVPSYLDRLQAGHHDLPVLLLPVINELRATHDADVVSEAALFAPDLDVPLPELDSSNDKQGGNRHAAANDESFQVLAQRMCQQYESALLLWLQDQENLDLLSPLQSVCATLQRRAEGTSLRRLWWIAAEVIGGLLDKVTDNDLNLRRLLSRLSLHLKVIAENGEGAADSDSVNAISQALLFHTAQARPGNAGVDLLIERFHLRDLVPEPDVLSRAQGAVSGHSRELYQSLGAAVRDELSLVKDALDLELRTGNIEPGRRRQSFEALSKLRDTLQMMGLADSSQSIEELMSAFVSTAEPDADSVSNIDGPLQESQLLELATKLIQVESVLDEQINTLGEPLLEEENEGYIELPAAEQHRIRGCLLNETVSSIQEVQEAVRQHLEGHEGADYEIGLGHIAGALEMVGETEIAPLVLQLGNALAVVLQVNESSQVAESDRLEVVVDAIAALELYLAGSRDEQGDHLRYLDILKQRLERLPVDEDATSAVETLSPSPDRDPEQPAETKAPEKTQSPATDEMSAVAADPKLLEIFLEEYESVSALLNEQIPHWMQSQDDSELMAEICRGFHTLKGSGRVVGADELGNFAGQIEAMISALLDNNIEAIGDVGTIVLLSAHALPALKQRLQQQPSELSTSAIKALGRQAEYVGRGKTPDWNLLDSELPATFAPLMPDSATAARANRKKGDVAVTRISTKDTAKVSERQGLTDTLVVLNGLMDSISKDRTYVATDEQISAIDAVVQTTASAQVSRETDIAKSVQRLLEAQRISGKAFGNTDLWLIATSLAHFETCLAVQAGDLEIQLELDEDKQIEQLDALALEYEKFEKPPQDTVESEKTIKEEKRDSPEDREPDTEIEPVDTDILNIFLEEAADILERCDSLLDTWRDDLSNLELVKNLQREIHTLKGGARMAGMIALGDLSHSMETLLERVAGQLVSPSTAVIESLEQGCDRLHKWTEQATQKSASHAEGMPAESEQQLDDFATSQIPPVVDSDQAVTTESAPDEVEETPVDATKTDELDVAERPEEAPRGQQPIRVNAELLDSLVNCAGEISIFRSRMEQQFSHLRECLKESDETVTRLRDQFRKLEIETETQIRSRYPQDIRKDEEGFDPLELDHFSPIQQLSRSLSESVADLLNLQELLDKSARKSEALLVKQSRVNTELQERLMQTRMVHFSTIAPRLRRIVRTAAGETGKKTRLQLRMAGAGDQLDRNVLERITAPLEHLIRNAIVHGIESAKVRKKLNKPEEGELCITVAAEATEFVVRVEDDGAGMDLVAIKKRAIELELIDKKAKPEPQQLLQLILQSGFSTSKKVTALAGRGVGMDVVNSEIKQVGGSIEIDSETGKGSLFTIRIPFTLAVMQAIGVIAGQRQYLIPLASVTGVARIKPAEYQALYENDQPTYGFSGQQYPVIELEPLLSEPSTPIGNNTVSILMIKAGNQRAAFRVPELLEHKEIVIKPVGPQISSVPGILGGTISGDGQVVVIIDSGPLIRRALTDTSRPAPPELTVDADSKQPLALVVDDSITMRKVTSRVLEGHNIEVFTARDGMDAMEQMQERVPELLLLDVEMPRMDGYQLAEYVRTDSRLREIPIIMITSRTGKKHCERGKKAGANAYISKPYKESELISEVDRLLGTDRT